MDRKNHTRQMLLLCALLAAVTLAAYWPVFNCGFTNLDDPDYVTLNRHVTSGLSWANVGWAFSSFDKSNWHPLTWLSHMLDVQLFGLDPRWQHLVSLLFHLANTLLLFGLLQRLTGAVWRSALVAALFALHPLHVESVAWIAERKDVLSAFFFFLTLLAYERYARSRIGEQAAVSSQPAPGGSQKSPPVAPQRLEKKNARGALHAPRFYLLGLLCFTLGLLSKPMLVTLPFLLLLLDFWPLGRWSFSRQAAPLKNHLVPLLVEKLPFFALSLASCVITYVAQQRGGAVAGLNIVPFDVRWQNALVAAGGYLEKFLWPASLAAYYPLVPPIPVAQVVGAALALALLSAVAFISLRQRPYLAVGWLWYAGMLVPVIGLVQVGAQAMADRYTYLPLIGIFIAIAWAIPDGAERKGRNPKSEIRPAAPASAKTPAQPRTARQRGENPKQMQNLKSESSNPGGPSRIEPSRRGILNFFQITDYGLRISSICLLVLAVCAVLTYRQAGYWKNSEAVYRHAIDATDNNYFVHENLATELIGQQRYAEAIEHLAVALKLNPQLAEAQGAWGLALASQGNYADAIPKFQAALTLKPGLTRARLELAAALIKTGQPQAGLAQYDALAQANPGSAETRCAIGEALASLGQAAEASARFEEALRLEPAYAEAHWNYGKLLFRTGKIKEAIEHLQQAVRSNPAAPVRLDLALALAAAGQREAAIEQDREALRSMPDSPMVLNNLAWLLAASPSDSVRNGPEAVVLAEKACRLTKSREAVLIGTLAAAYAEAGRFEDAVRTAAKAIDVATAAGEKPVADKNRQLLELYRTGKPYHEGS